MSVLRIKTAEIFEPLLRPTRYKGAYGGRGSGKSHFFAENLVFKCISEPGTRAVCVREVQKDLSQSSKRTIEDKIQSLGVGQLFDITKTQIATPGDGIIIFQGMQDHTAESVKSLEGYKIAWVEEAQGLSERSLQLLRPTIRMPNSELWFSWNPTRKKDAIERFLRQEPPANSIVVKANWRDNPFWNETLEGERKLELSKYPERYAHTWEGEYAGAFEGAYFARDLTQARLDGRICKVSADPLLPIRGFSDIGGAGANADAFVFWIVQWVGREIRVLDYYEAIGQPLAEHAHWLRSRGWDRAILRFPHDGINANNITGKRYEDHFREAGFQVDPSLANQGKGAAAMRIEAVRRLFPQIVFNEATTEDGRLCLGFYHEKRDEQRGAGLGPDHDWSSHGADGFGLMAVCYEEPSRTRAFSRKIEYPSMGIV